MHSFSKQISRLLLCLSLISICHFLILQLQLPVRFNLLLTGILGIGVIIVFLKATAPVPVLSYSVPWQLALILPLFATAFLFHTRKYGGWDATGIYHLAANYLTHPQAWKNMWLLPRQHGDYPLLLGSLIGFFRQLFPGIPTYLYGYCLSVLFTLAIPCLLFVEIRTKSFFLAWATLLAFFANLFYLNSGINQYADIPLAGFTLLAFIALQHLKDKGHPNLIWLCWTALGAMIWTKNEGIFYAAVFILFQVKSLLRFTKVRPVSFLYFLLFVLSLFLLKHGAHQNDLFQHARSASAWSEALRFEKLKMILVFLTSNFVRTFPIVAILFFAFLLQSAYCKRLPTRSFWIVVSFIIGIVCVYMLSPYGLRWHLATSATRLLLQVSIPLTYVLAQDWPRKNPKRHPESGTT